MKDLSLQWRITLMTAALVCAACLSMNFLVGYSGMQYMDEIGSEVSAYSNVNEDIPKSFDPGSEDVGNELTIVVSDAQKSFGATSWCITALVTLIGGVLAYFASGRALRPLRAFAAQIGRDDDARITTRNERFEACRRHHIGRDAFRDRGHV